MHRLAIIDFYSEQPLCFIEVWCNQPGKWEQLLLISFDRSRLEKGIAAGRYNHGIDHEWNARRKLSVDVAYRFRYGRNDLRGAKQAGFHRADREISNKHFDLLANNPRANRLNPRNFAGNLRDDARDRRQ